MSTMRVLRVISSMNPQKGGPCQGIRNAIPELAKFGVINEVVCLDDPDSAFLKEDPFTIHALGKSRPPWGYNPKLIPWLEEHMGNYEAVVVHGLWLYHSYATIKAMKFHRNKHKYSPKVFVMPHGMLDPYFQKAEDRKMKAIRNNIYWRLIENKVINNADGILFTCEEELLLARTTFPNYRPRREINAGYGVQSPPEWNETMKAAFAHSTPGWNGAPFILFLSRIHPKKGVDLLIKAYMALEKKFDHMPQLVIAGPGLDRKYGMEMQELASGSSNILFPGMLKDDAKWGAFYGCEVFILPSHQENFGIAVVEALACKKPVLISDKVNIWREILEKQGGMVKKDTEVETLSLLQEWMELSAEEKHQTAELALNTYYQKFTMGRVAKKFVEEIR